MKAWLLSLIVFTLIVALGAVSTHFLFQSSNQLVSRIKQIDQNLTHRNWHQAAIKLKEIAHSWHKLQPWWAILIHHQEIDNIERALIQMQKAIICRDYPNSQISSGELIHFLQHIPRREQLTITNIL